MNEHKPDIELQNFAQDSEEERKKKAALLAEEALKQTHETLEFWKSVNELLERLGKPVFTFLKSFTEAIPPLKLALGAITAIWEVGTAVLVKKKRGWHLGRKTGLAVTALALAAGAFFAPVAAAGLFIAGAAITLSKDTASSVRSWQQHRQHKKALEQLHPLQRSPEMHEKVRESKKAAINKTVHPVLGAVALVGAVMLAIPFLQPVGLILLVASAALGIFHKLTNAFLSRKSAVKNQTAPTPTPDKKSSTRSSSKKNKDKEEDEDGEGEQRKPPEPESTAHIYVDMANTVHSNKSVQAEARDEIKHSMMPIQKPTISKPTSAPTHETHHEEEFFETPRKEKPEQPRQQKHRGEEPRPHMNPSPIDD